MSNSAQHLHTDCTNNIVMAAICEGSLPIPGGGTGGGGAGAMGPGGGGGGGPPLIIIVGGGPVTRSIRTFLRVKQFTAGLIVL